MTAPKVKRLLSGLAAQLPAGEAYLEVGIHAGATLLSALADHPGTTAYAFDNWVEFLDEGGRHPRELLFENLKIHASRLPAVEVIERDIFRYLKEERFAKPLGLVFYDGSHAEHDQERFVVDVYPHLARESILVVDDFDWVRVERGSHRGIERMPWKSKQFHRRRGPGKVPNDSWHFGIGAWHLVKP